MGDPHRELMDGLSSLHVNGRYSDLTIKCKSRTWAVHRAILCSRSGFFDGASGGLFQEAHERLIDLSEDDQEAVEHMIHYFYHLDYLVASKEDGEPSLGDVPAQHLDLTSLSDPLLAQAKALSAVSPQLAVGSSTDMSTQSKSPVVSIKVRTTRTARLQRQVEPDRRAGSEGTVPYEETDNSHLLSHARVYAIAEKYEIPGLKSLARDKFEVSVACYYDSPEVADAIAEVYASTIDSDRGLRNVVIQAFRRHPQLASTQDVYAVITTTPSLALELWKTERGLPV